MRERKLDTQHYQYMQRGIIVTIADYNFLNCLRRNDARKETGHSALPYTNIVTQYMSRGIIVTVAGYYKNK